MLECVSHLAEQEVRLSNRRLQALENLFSKIEKVVSLPHSAGDLLRLANEPSIDAKALTEVIRQDPALAARILKQVNSSHFGLSHHVSDLGHAISLLGTNEIRKIALTLNCSPLMGKMHQHGAYSREGLWHHSVVVGCLAEHLATKIKHPCPGVFYTAGLLHDLGWLLMDQHMWRYFERTLDLIHGGTRRQVSEAQVFTFEHTLLGAGLAERWNLPNELASVMLHHHSPKSYFGKHRALVNAVAIANYLCDQQQIWSLGVSTVSFPGDDIFHSLGLTSRQTQEVVAAIPAIAEKAKRFCEATAVAG